MTTSLRREDGSVLIVTIAVTGILSLLVGVAFAVARQAIRAAGATENVHGALAAAEAGLDDYIFRLNDIDEYWTYDHTSPGPDNNPAFVADATNVAIDDPAWTPVPGGGQFGEFVYSVDTSRLPTEGVISLTSTGRIRPPDGATEANNQYVQRTVRATVKQSSFLDFLYFTDFETLDPIAYSTVANQTWAAANCSVHRWVSERPAGCIDITWANDDRVNGPFHTNDRWRISGGPEWTGDVSGSAIDLNFYTGSGTPVFGGGPPFYQAPLEMPPSNAQLRVLADHRGSGEGCLYTGPTEIIMNANGTLRVDSPYTRESGTGCGTFSGAGNDPPQTVNLPSNGVIFVQAIPANATDPNHTVGCPFGNNGLGYPISLSGGTWVDDTPYSCRDGDAFVEGTLDGRLTIAAANDITITWHLLYDGTDDMLGLIANDFVQIYHPVDVSQSDAWEDMYAAPNHPTVEFRNPQINAAILSVNHSFLVPFWNQGDNNMGTITLNGAIAQIYRGPVGTFSGTSQVTGFDKDYNYDARLRYTNPPHFIDPVKASWRILQYAEQFD